MAGLGEVAMNRSFQINGEAHDPKLKLLQPLLPARLEGFDPFAVCRSVGEVDDHLHEVVAIEDSLLSPMTFDFLSFIAGSAEMLDYFKNSFSQPFWRNLGAVVELEWKEHLESPPLAGHRSPALLR